MTIHTGITETDRKSVSDQLTKLLADEFVLYTKTRNAHWNVEGADFHAMHKYFEEQYQQIDELTDSVAERIRKIGHYAPATLTQLLSLTHLTEKTHGKTDSIGFIQELLADHESIIKYLRGNIEPFADRFNDQGSSDFITSLMQIHEEIAWMLRAHLS